MWKRCLALTLTLAMVLLAAPAYALDPSTTLETAPTISPNSTNKFTTPKYNSQTWYYKLELPYAGVITVSLLVYDRDTCPYFDIKLRDRINKVQGAYKKMASANTGYQSITNSSKGTPVPLFTAEVPAGSYFLDMFGGSGATLAVVCEFTCPHSNYSYTIETEPATCAATGYTSKVCGNCGHLYDTETIARLAHTLAKDGWTVVKKPTCTATGTKTQTCSVCKQLQGQTLSSLGHDYSDWAVTTPTSCAAPGEKARTCARCQKTQTQALPQLSHTYGDWVPITSPTCTGSGKQVRVCAKCGNEEANFLSPTGHSYGDWAVTTPPTCTAQGVETQTCPLCGDAQTRVIAKLEHEYGDWAVTTPPTCTALGEETKTCLHCPAAKTREVAKTEHTYDDDWYITDFSTCTHSGEAIRSCKQCGRRQTKRLDTLPHQYTSWKISSLPTAESNGLLSSDCDYGCGRGAATTFFFSSRTHLGSMAPKGTGYQCWWDYKPKYGVMAIMLPEGCTFLVACYDDQGNFLEAKPVIVDKRTRLTGALEKARLFLLDENLAPLDVSQLITDHPLPAA